MKTLFVLLFFSLSLLVWDVAQAQERYWLLFTHKTDTACPQVSPRTLAQRATLGLPVWQATDDPVSEDFLGVLREMGVRPLVVSRWLNACSAVLDAGQLGRVLALPFVRAAVPMRIRSLPARLPDADTESHALAWEQVEGEHFKALGLDGRGVRVGVIDAGFYAAQRSRFLGEIFEESRIQAVRDFVDPSGKDLFKVRQTSSDSHGTQVLEYIAGHDPKTGRRQGLATGAEFYLARTDHGDKEFRGEEDHWVAALEWMDSLGVRLINTSLGYSMGFDDPKENYRIEQIDGETAITTRAAQIAARQKGMLIICSAGNEGSDPSWRVLSAPADAPDVIAVGATNKAGLRMSYSSLGPERLPYLKPNLACYALFGTSFAAPVITGFVACLLQHDSTLTRQQAFAALERSCGLYPYGNNFVGYGVPNAARALQFLQQNPPQPLLETVSAKGLQYLIKPKEAVDEAIVFHKKDARNVVQQDYLKAQNGRFRVKRYRQSPRTTVFWGNAGVEIIWEE